MNDAVKTDVLTEEKLSDYIDYNADKNLYNRIFKYKRRHPEKTYAEIVEQYNNSNGKYSNSQLHKQVGHKLATKIRCYLSNHRNESFDDVVKMFVECDNKYGDIPINRYKKIIKFIESHPEYKNDSADVIWDKYRKAKKYEHVLKSREKNKEYFNASLRMSYYIKRGDLDKAKEMKRLRESFKVGNQLSND